MEIIPEFGNISEEGLISVAASLLLGLAIIFIILILTRNAKMKERYRLPKVIFRMEKWPIAVIGGLFLFFFTFPFGNYDDGDLYRKWTTIALIIGFTWFLLKLLSVVKELIVMKFSIEKADNLQARKVRTQFQYVQAILSIIIIFLGAGLVLWQFEELRTLSSGVLASAGILTIVIAFAANQSLANLIAGFQLAFSQPFRLDDVVIVEGEWGKIEEITLTYVVVKIWDQRRMVLPITYFTTNPFQNWTRTSAEIIGSVYLYVDYKVPVEEVRTKLEEIVKGHKLWDGRVVVLQVTDTSERTVALRALVSARNASDAWDLRCFVREKLVGYLQKNHPDSLPLIRVEERPHSREFLEGLTEGDEGKVKM